MTLHKEGNYSHLQSKTVHAEKIIVNTLVLKDTTLQSDISMAGTKVKQLYESQRNTNCFSDNDKMKLDTLNEMFSKQCNVLKTECPMYNKLVYLQDIDIESIPLMHSLLCIDKQTNTLLNVANVNGELKMYKYETYIPYVRTDIIVDENSEVKINLNVI